jgi:sigma-B regulation protein RsbU (phosphoserine phosphatase)
MTQRYTLPSAPSPPSPSLAQRLRSYLIGSLQGRVLLLALLVFAFGQAGVPMPETLQAIAGILLLLFGVFHGQRLVRYLLRRLLWRIRTKLIVSYLFIAVVPVVLLVLFFAIAGMLSLTLVASYMVASQLERTAQQLQAIAHAAALGLDAPTTERFQELLDRRLQPARALHPNLSYAYGRDATLLAASGDCPRRLPEWVRAKKEFAGLVHESDKPEVVRAAWSDGRSFLVLEVPLDEAMTAAMEKRTGIQVVPGLRLRAQVDARGMRIREAGEERGRLKARLQEAEERPGMTSFALADRTDWETGKSEVEPLQIRFQPMLLLRQLSPMSRDIADVLLVRGMTVVGVLFLTMYSVALALGLLLARSITSSIHQLTRGTERIRQGDFDHRIRVRSRDQLGELAESFNVMTRGIQDLLRESAEKERLEEELRIARQIQMSLLPQDAVSLPGLRVAALCLPAAEVGGDYYDLLPLSETRLGVLVADVSGKGTSAALYMAELKGLVLSLSRIYASPAKLLTEANRILGENMDSRSFVTMTYAVVDTAARRMRYARAGHNPLIHFEAASGRTRVLAPAGLGLGIDRGDRFEKILEEAELPLASGDVLLFFTDGLSEAMNSRAELFGEQRLRDVLEAGEQLSSEELKERILAEIRSFVDGAAQHDDMTLVILKVT